eukprot:936708-Karenia_brevis.AAC.1
MNSKQDFRFRANDPQIEWDSANIRMWIDGGSRAGEQTSASAYLVKVSDRRNPKLRIIAAGAKFHMRPAENSLSIEAEAMRNAWKE